MYSCNPTSQSCFTSLHINPFVAIIQSYACMCVIYFDYWSEKRAWKDKCCRWTLSMVKEAKNIARKEAFWRQRLLLFFKVNRNPITENRFVFYAFQVLFEEFPKWFLILQINCITLRSELNDNKSFDDYNNELLKASYVGFSQAVGLFIKDVMGGGSRPNAVYKRCLTEAWWIVI